MQADGRSLLPGHRAELLDGRAAAPGHGQGQSVVGEQGPAGGVGGAVDQGGGAGREAGGGQGRIEGVGHDRSGRSEGVGSDAEHHGIAAAQDPAGVGEHVRTSLEHEPDHAEPGPALLEAPAIVVHDLDGQISTRWGVSPHPQPVDHPGPHGVGQLETGGRATPLPGPLDVGGVGLGDRSEGGIVGQGVGEAVEEGGDGDVRYRPEGGEGGRSPIDGSRGHPLLRRRDVEQIARAVDHEEPVALDEGLGQLRWDPGHPIPTVDDGLSGLEVLQPLAHRASLPGRRSVGPRPRPRRPSVPVVTRWCPSNRERGSSRPTVFAVTRADTAPSAGPPMIGGCLVVGRFGVLALVETDPLGVLVDP